MRWLKTLNSTNDFAEHRFQDHAQKISQTALAQQDVVARTSKAEMMIVALEQRSIVETNDTTYRLVRSFFGPPLRIPASLLGISRVVFLVRSDWRATRKGTDESIVALSSADGFVYETFLGDMSITGKQNQKCAMFVGAGRVLEMKDVVSHSVDEKDLKIHGAQPKARVESSPGDKRKLRQLAVLKVHWTG